jgi:class I fructose-bisphosphate aldolase
MENIDQLLELLGGRRRVLLNHVCKTITKDQIHLPHQISQDTFASETDKLLVNTDLQSW